MIKLGENNELSNKVYWYSLTRSFLILLIIALSFGILTGDPQNIFLMFVLLFTLLGIPILLIIFLKYKKITFIVENNSLTISSGILKKHSNLIPFSNIQNIESTSGPLLRLFQLDCVKIWTAASPQSGKVNKKLSPGEELILENENARWLKKFISNDGTNGIEEKTQDIS